MKSSKLKLSRARLRRLSGDSLAGAHGATALPFSPYCVTPLPGQVSFGCATVSDCHAISVRCQQN
jgi:hypothetical protein